MSIVLDWNGEDVPDELKELPAGRYMVQPLEDSVLSSEEEEGVVKALESLRRGNGVSHDEVKDWIQKVLGA